MMKYLPVISVFEAFLRILIFKRQTEEANGNIALATHYYY